MSGVRGVMTSNPVVLAATTPMHDVVRGLADRKVDASSRERAKHRIVGVPSDAKVEDALLVMRAEKVRRVLVVEGNDVIGIVSIADLFQEHDRRTALADIGAAQR